MVELHLLLLLLRLPHLLLLELLLRRLLLHVLPLLELLLRGALLLLLLELLGLLLLELLGLLLLELLGLLLLLHVLALLELLLRRPLLLHVVHLLRHRAIRVLLTLRLGQPAVLRLALLLPLLGHAKAVCSLCDHSCSAEGHVGSLLLRRLLTRLSWRTGRCLRQSRRRRRTLPRSFALQFALNSLLLHTRWEHDGVIGVNIVEVNLYDLHGPSSAVSVRVDTRVTLGVLVAIIICPAHF